MRVLSFTGMLILDASEGRDQTLESVAVVDENAVVRTMAGEAENGWGSYPIQWD